jgi:hypothetical protein
VAAFTTATAVVAAVSAWTARETYKLPMHLLGHKAGDAAAEPELRAA